MHSRYPSSRRPSASRRSAWKERYMLLNFLNFFYHYLSRLNMDADVQYRTLHGSSEILFISNIAAAYRGTLCKNHTSFGFIYKKHAFYNYLQMPSLWKKMRLWCSILRNITVCERHRAEWKWNQHLSQDTRSNAEISQSSRPLAFSLNLWDKSKLLRVTRSSLNTATDPANTIQPDCFEDLLPYRQ